MTDHRFDLVDRGDGTRAAILDGVDVSDRLAEIAVSTGSGRLPEVELRYACYPVTVALVGARVEHLCPFGDDADELRELLGRMLGHYQHVSGRLPERRDAQTIAIAEVLRYLEGDRTMLEELRDLDREPLTLADLPPRLGGTG